MKPPADEMKEYWSYIKKEINPMRKKAGLKLINYTEAKYMFKQIKLMGGRRNS